MALLRSPSPVSVLMAVWSATSALSSFAWLARYPAERAAQSSPDKRTNLMSFILLFLLPIILQRHCQESIRANVRIWFYSAIETVSQPADAHDIARLRWVRFDLFSQGDDVVVNYTIGHERAVPPDEIQKLVPAQHFAAAADQGGEQLELEGGEIPRLAGTPQLAASKIHLRVAEPEDSRFIFRGAAERRLDPGPQLARAERLGYVVVGADLEPQRFLRLLGLA